MGFLHQLRLYIITSVIGRFCRAQQRASAGGLLNADDHHRHHHTHLYDSKGDFWIYGTPDVWLWGLPTDA